MLMLTLAISCLTTSYLPWFMDLEFQVPLQYCSLQHRTLHPSPVTSTTGCCFYFAYICSFFLELFLHWSPAAYWAPTDLGSSSSVSCLFAFSYCSWGSQGKNTEVDGHSLLQSTTFCQNAPSWAIQGGRVMVESSDKRVPLEKGMANHFSILALRSPWTEWKGKELGHLKMNSPGW